MKKQQIIFKGSGRITTAAFIKNENMRYGQIRFKGGGRINNVRITGLDNGGGGGGEDPIYKDDECLGFTAVDGDVTVSLQNYQGNAPIVYYKRKGDDWVLWNYSGLNIAEGETVRFYGDNNFTFNFGTYSSSYTQRSEFVMSGLGKIKASGSCNSLLSKEKIKVVVEYTFGSLFRNCKQLISAPELPATTLSSYCYYEMFSGCTNLVDVPELPATTLALKCYANMFMNCTSITKMPKLSAIDLKADCYSNMFNGCTSLAEVFDLPAKVLKNACYAGMFTNCVNLVVAPKILATTSAQDCCKGMFSNCTSLVTPPELLPTTLYSRCYQQMFEGCKSLTNVMNLPATELDSYCYFGMFKDCEGLTNISLTLPATTLKSNCYQNMFYGCSNLLNAPKLPATTLAYACYSNMFRSCVSLVNAPELLATTLFAECYESMFYSCLSLVNTPSTLPAKTLLSNCYRGMFRGCELITKAPNILATTLASRCCEDMFNGCINLINAPELYATTLVSACYNTMFYRCAKINYIKALFTTTPSNSYTSSWLYGVATTGTFVKNPNATWDVSGPNGIPNDWTVVAEKELKSITFTKGGYINTGVKFVPGDNIRFKFKIKNVSGGALLFGAGTPSSNGYSNRFTFNRNEASGSIAQISSSGNNTTTLKFFSTYAILDNTETDINFSFAGQDKSFFTINGNSTVINEFNINNKPNTATQYSLYLNNYNFGGQIPSLNINGADMTFYGFEMYDELGMTKCKLIPVLTPNGPKIKNTETNSYIDISIVEGKTVDISYEEL